MSTQKWDDTSLRKWKHFSGNIKKTFTMRKEQISILFFKLSDIKK